MSDKQVRRGDIYWCPVMEINEGGELYVGTPRPVVVVSNDKCNESSSNITVVPITSQEKKPLPIHVEVSVGKINGTALCEKVSIATKDNLGYFCGSVSGDKIEEIDEALRFQHAPWIGLPADEYEEYVLRAIHYRIGKEESDEDRGDDEYDDED